MEINRPLSRRIIVRDQEISNIQSVQIDTAKERKKINWATKENPHHICMKARNACYTPIHRSWHHSILPFVGPGVIVRHVLAAQLGEPPLDI
jgi:hypothetical protein